MYPAIQLSVCSADKNIPHSPYTSPLSCALNMVGRHIDKLAST